MRLDAQPHVLVVEDEYIIAHDLVDAIEAAGSVVIGPADNLVVAQMLLSNGDNIDLGILDLNISGAKVYPIAELLWERGVPFIFLTGQDGEVVPSRFCSIPICMKPMKASVVVFEAFAFADLVRHGGKNTVLEFGA